MIPRRRLLATTQLAAAAAGVPVRAAAQPGPPALVFRHVFFPALGAAAGTVAAIATFAVAFLARPLGSVLFGRLGDRVGRPSTPRRTAVGGGACTRSSAQVSRSPWPAARSWSPAPR